MKVLVRFAPSRIWLMVKVLPWAQAPAAQTLPLEQEEAVHSHLPLVALQDGVSPEQAGLQVAATHLPVASQVFPFGHEESLQTQLLVVSQSGVAPLHAGVHGPSSTHCFVVGWQLWPLGHEESVHAQVLVAGSQNGVVPAQAGVQEPGVWQAPSTQVSPLAQELSVHSQASVAGLQNGVGSAQAGSQVPPVWQLPSTHAWPLGHEVSLHTQVEVVSSQSGVGSAHAGEQAPLLPPASLAAPPSLGAPASPDAPPSVPGTGPTVPPQPMAPLRVNSRTSFLMACSWGMDATG
jgi:hypothetical protein